MSRAFCEKEKENDLFSAGRIALAFGIRNDGGDEYLRREKREKREEDAIFFQRSGSRLRFTQRTIATAATATRIGVPI